MRYIKTIVLILIWGNTLAQTELDSLLNVWSNPNQADSTRLDAIDEIAAGVYLYSMADSAYAYAQLQFELADSLAVHSEGPVDLYIDYKAKAKKTQASSLRLRGEYDEALLLYHESMELQKDRLDTLAVASCLNSIGIVYAQKNLYDKALYYFELALDEFKASGSQERMAASYNNIGNFHRRRGAYSKSIEFHMQSLRIRESLSDTKGIATSQNNIGNVFRALGDFEKAIEYHEKALQTRRELNEEYDLIVSLNNLGSIILEMAFEEHSVLRGKSPKVDYQKAESYFSEAMRRSETVSNKKEIAIALGGIAHILQHKGKLDEAMEYYQESLALKEQLQNSAGISIALNNIGSIHFEKAEQLLDFGHRPGVKKHLEKAISLQEEALSISEEIGVYVEGRDICKSLYSSYKLNGQTDKALEMYEEYVERRDSMMSTVNQYALIDQEYQYTYAKKALTDSLAMVIERQEMKQAELDMMAGQKRKVKYLFGGFITFFLFALLATYIYRLRQSRRLADKEAETSILKLKGAESEMKALRSQMNPHFIFNALQSIQSFLINRKIDDAEEYLLKFSKLMRAVLENSQFDEVPLESDLKALGLYMELESIRLKYPFTYSFEVAEEIDQSDVLIPPLILQPLVENSIWHGLQHKQEPGHIHVQIGREDNRLVCSVIDNGLGRKASKRVIQNEYGKKESLGMKITEQRLRVRDERTGTHSTFEVVDLTSELNESLGTKVELTIPIAA